MMLASMAEREQLRRVYSAKIHIIFQKTSHRVTKEEKSGKIVANQGIGMETAE